MVSRFLVTTALEETWPTDGSPVLFLGEWCRLFNRRNHWGKLDAEVVPYHWDDRSKLHQDYVYLQSVYEEILPILAAKLNELHGVDHSVRYWRILVGPWLGYFIQMLFDRWFMLQKVVRDYDILGVRIIKRGEGEGVPNDMADFSALFVGDDWNELIYGQILEGLLIPTETIEVGRTRAQHRDSSTRVTPTASTRVKRTLVKLASHVSGILCRDDEFFFIHSYLSIKNDLLLQARLGQLPKWWKSVGVPKADYYQKSRQWALLRPETEKADVYGDFLNLLCTMVPKHLPTAYFDFDGYRQLVALTDNLPWPKRPKAIFTSDAYSTDDVFKIWAAAKVEKGIPLVIGQHGGNYGIGRWTFEEEHQVAIADRFITWGWEDSAHQKVVPVGNLKGFLAKAVPKKTGVALLVEMTVPRYSSHMYSVPVGAGQWQSYFEDQCRFVEALPEKLRASVLVRLFAHDYGCGQEQRWRSRFQEISLDSGRKPMSALLKQTRLYISTYNATTYLESLSLNFPTIIFWNTVHWELRESAKPYFERLQGVGIFHETPESAARQMAAVWDDVSGWWESAAVQLVRREFCERYAHIPEQPLDVMKDLFLNLAD